MKKIFLIFIILMFPICLVKANSISSFNMDVYIDNNGDAIITETWESNVDNGSEGYHPYYNLG